MNNSFRTADAGAALRKNKFPGFGTLVGLSKNGKYAVVACFYTGKSDEDRNVKFNDFGDEVMLMPRIAGQPMGERALVSSPVKKSGQKVFVNDGSLTDLLCEASESGKCCVGALCGLEASKKTRVGGIVCLGEKFSYKLFCVKPADEAASANNAMIFSFSPVAGVGHLVTEFGKDKKPFSGEPARVTVLNNSESFTEKLWKSLGDDRAALVVRYISLSSGRVTARMRGLD